METDVIDNKMVMHVIKSEIRNGHVMHVIHVIFFITCTTSHYFQLHALHAITWYVLVCSGFHVPYIWKVAPCYITVISHLRYITLSKMDITPGKMDITCVI
jgi:hypothetical protein